MSKILVYTNIYAESVMSNKVMKKFINNALNTKKWTVFGEVKLPKVFDNKISINGNFLMGVAVQQYNIVSQREGGIFINPFLCGVMTNFEIWNDLLYGVKEFDKEIIFLNIPYDIYVESLGQQNIIVTQEVYDDNSIGIKELVENIESDYYERSNKKKYH